MDKRDFVKKVRQIIVDNLDVERPVPLLRDETTTPRKMCTRNDKVTNPKIIGFSVFGDRCDETDEIDFIVEHDPYHYEVRYGVMGSEKRQEISTTFVETDVLSIDKAIRGDIGIMKRWDFVEFRFEDYELEDIIL